MNKPGRTILAALTGAGAALALAGAADASTPGSLDPSFGRGGLFIGAIGSYTAGIASAVQPNGDIVTVGAATLGGLNEMIATRLLPNGTIDRSFAINGWAPVPVGQAANANAVAIQPDGDIVLAGTGRNPTSGTLTFSAVRLLPNGLLDPAFGSGGVVTVPIGSEAIANAVAIERNGEILLGGTALTDHNHIAAVLLTQGGALDPSFGNGGVALVPQNAGAWGMALESSGEIVLGGPAVYHKTQAYMAARLLPDGVLDNTFGSGGVVTVPIGSTATALAVAAQPNGNILLTGNAVTTRQVAATVRLLPTGALDSTFGSKGISMLAGGGVNAIALQSDGKIVLAGPGPSAVRLTPTGSLDLTFGNKGLKLISVGGKASANGVVIQPADGNIVLSGAANLSGRMVLLDARLLG